MKIYRSKVSPFILAIFLIPIGLVLNEMYKTKNYENWWVLPLVFVPIILSLFSIRYIIKEHILQIKMFGFNYLKIDVHSIKTIEKSYNPLSSPAADFKRLDITYGKYSNVLVSPKNFENFIADLKAVNPLIIVKL